MCGVLCPQPTVLLGGVDALEGGAGEVIKGMPLKGFRGPRPILLFFASGSP